MGEQEQFYNFDCKRWSEDARWKRVIPGVFASEKHRKKKNIYTFYGRYQSVTLYFGELLQSKTGDKITWFSLPRFFRCSALKDESIMVDPPPPWVFLLREILCKHAGSFLLSQVTITLDRLLRLVCSQSHQTMFVRIANRNNVCKSSRVSNSSLFVLAVYIVHNFIL